MCLHSPCALLYLIHNLARIAEWGIKMGKYDNYSFKKGIEKAQRRLNRLLRRKRCDPEKLEKAKKDFENAKLFESCQIFRSFLSDAPGKNIMFSDDNRVIWMLGHVIPYDDLASYSIYGTGKTITQTTTRARGVFSRAYIGHAIAGDVGAILGAATAPVETTTYDVRGLYFVPVLKERQKRRRSQRPSPVLQGGRQAAKEVARASAKTQGHNKQKDITA